jgi:hypothetical protein
VARVGTPCVQRAFAFVIDLCGFTDYADKE